MKNLDTVAEELFNKIRGRFPSVTVGDESATITNQPNTGRFFEFTFASGKKVNISLNEKDLTIMYSKNLFGEDENVLKDKWFDFLKELRQFAKKRMLNFDTRDINKSNLDKRDYEYLSTEKQMSESKMYGTSRTSYQDVGTARMVVKHAGPVNHENAAGRTQNVHSIYIESEGGERFKYPYRHLNGARAMTRHVAEGGTPYDDFGKHITGLSEELVNLRKFKTYMNRSSVMAEGLLGYMDIVNERLNTVKKTVEMLQRENFYKESVSTFKTAVLEDVPEDVSNTWIDELTIKQFNEELKGVFPYIYKLVSEANKVEEIGPEELLGETDDQVQEAYIKTSKDAIDTLGALRKIGKSIETGDGEYEGNLANMYANDVYDVMSWVENNLDTNDAKFKQVMEPVVALRKKAKGMEREPGSGKDARFGNEIVNTLYPLMQWIEMNGMGEKEGMSGEDWDHGQYDMESAYEAHLESIISNAKHEKDPTMEKTKQFEMFKEQMAISSIVGLKEFNFNNKTITVNMDSKLAEQVLAENPLRWVAQAAGKLIPGVGAGARQGLDDIARAATSGARTAAQGARTAAQAAAPAVGQAARTTGQAIGKGAAATAGAVGRNVVQPAAKAAGAVGAIGGGAYLAGDQLMSAAGDAISAAGDKIVTSAGDLTSALGDRLAGMVPNIGEIGAMAAKYALPVGLVIAAIFGGSKLLGYLFGGKDEKEGIEDKMNKRSEKSNDVPLEEYVKSMYDYTNYRFPKGETAVLTQVQKQYGDHAVDEAQSVMSQLVSGQDEEMARIQQLAGVR